MAVNPYESPKTIGPTTATKADPFVRISRWLRWSFLLGLVLILEGALDRALPILKPGHSLRFLTLPDNLDPDELIRRDGVAAMRGLIDKAAPLVDFLWRQELAQADLSTPERRAAFEMRIGQRVREIADARLQVHYRDELRGRVRELMAAARPKPASGARRGAARGGRFGQPFAPLGASAQLRANRLARGENPGAGSNEALILLLLIRHPRLLPRVADDLIRVELASPGLDRLRSALLSISFDAPDLDTDKVRGHLADVGLAETIARLEKDPFLAMHAGVREDVTIDMVEEEWRHALALHFRQILRAELSEAQASYEASPSDTGILRRIQAIREELTRIESQVQSAGADGGFSA